MVLEPAMRKAPPPHTNDEKAKFVKLLTELGPQVTEIASRIHIHKETIRYWYHGLLEQGFTVQASYNYEKLGMKRLIMLKPSCPAIKVLQRAPSASSCCAWLRTYQSCPRPP
jgi:hypothetical protein